MAKKLDTRTKEEQETAGRKGSSRGGSRKRTTSNRSRNVKMDKDSKYNDNHSSSDNDPSWYSIDNQLINNAGQISFFNPAGSQIHALGYNGIAVPGVMGLAMTPTAGVNNNAFSPINVAAKRLYDRINYKNSRNFTYESSDLMIYVFTTASAYAYHAFLKRIYGILNTYSTTNWYIPDALLYSMGVAAKDMRLHLSDLRYYINYLGRKISALSIPAGFPLYARWVWLNSNVYMDADTIKSSIYVPYFSSYYRYVADTLDSDNTTVIGGSAILDRPKASKAELPSKTFSGFDDLQAFGNSIIEALIGDQDIGNMSADVLKACEGKIMYIDATSDDYAVIPTYSLEVLDQIHNARFYGVPDLPTATGTSTGTKISSFNSGVVYQKGNVIKSNLVVTPLTGTVGPTVMDQVLVDTVLPNPTASDVMTMTRLLNFASFDSDKSKYTLEACGSEVGEAMYIVWIDASGTPSINNITSFLYYQSTAGALSAVRLKVLMNALQDSISFTHKPYITFGIRDADGGTNISHALNDMYNYTTVSQDQLRRLHEVALLSEFNFYS